MSDPIDTGDSAKTSGLKSFSLGTAMKERSFDLDSMDIDELLAWRDRIDAKLPKTSIKDINLEEEVLLQFHRVKALQEKTALDDEIPTNQRAQVANTVAATLREIVKMRGEIYNSEQFRKMEASLAKALRTLPEDAQNVFYAAYEKAAMDLADAEKV